jgi:SPP1 gp7 family putative phage head morphogenesis protein
LVRVEKRITITDAVLLQDTIEKHRYLAVRDYISLVEGLSLFAQIPDRPSIVVRERSLEVAETIRLLAKDAKESLLRRRLKRAKDPSLTRKVENEYAREVDRLFVAFKDDAAKILGLRHLAMDDGTYDWDVEEVSERLNRTIEVTITIPGKGVVKKFTTRAYTSGGLRGSQFITSLGIKAVFSILPADKAALDILLTRDMSDLKGITDEMSKQIVAELTDGMLRGDSPHKIAKAIDDRIDSIGRVRAEVMARTEVMTAFNKGALTQYEKLGITEVEWLAGIDDRTCAECALLDGQRFPIDRRPDMPAHPNCRCVYLPVIPEI